jgi:hypothetical protein
MSERRASGQLYAQWCKDPLRLPAPPQQARLRPEHVITEGSVLLADEVLWLRLVGGPDAVTLSCASSAPSPAGAVAPAAAGAAGTERGLPDDSSEHALALLEAQPRALLRCRARCELCELGWIVRDGGETGADFLLYEAGVNEVHATAAVVAAENEGRYDAAWLSGLHRAAQAASRELWLWTQGAGGAPGSLQRMERLSV